MTFLSSSDHFQMNRPFIYLPFCAAVCAYANRWRQNKSFAAMIMKGISGEKAIKQAGAQQKKHLEILTYVIIDKIRIHLFGREKRKEK